jgi:hypothetical protein
VPLARALARQCECRLISKVRHWRAKALASGTPWHPRFLKWMDHYVAQHIPRLHNERSKKRAVVPSRGPLRSRGEM